MRIYIAAPWASRQSMSDIASRVEALGYTITHKWWEVEDIPEAERFSIVLKQQADFDLAGVLSADIMLVINSSKSEGKAFEQGVFTAKCALDNTPRHIVIVGDRGKHSANVFHYLPHYVWVPNLTDAVALLRSLLTPIKVPDSKASNPKDIIGSDKLPLGIVPAATMAYLALGHTEGHIKYGFFNFRELGVRASIYIDALYRHINKWMDGEEDDLVTRVPHLANALACLSIIVDAKEAGKLVDDRPKATFAASKVIERFSDNVRHLKKLFGASKPIDYFITGPKQRP